MNTLIKYNGVDICREEQLVLKGVDLEVGKGEFVYLVGKVGSGKSSLLKSFYAEVPVLTGEAQIFEYNLPKIRRKEIPPLRRKLGIVFQDFQLLIDRSVSANLEFVLRATGWSDKSQIETRINEVLEHVGMSNKGYKMPHELSGGEQQRIVIARALLNSPEIILADEPTGNLDPHTGDQIMQLLYHIRENGTTIIMATHNMNFVHKYSGRVFECADERLVARLM
ncbi:phosphonate ABC transporter ATP-binding protein [Bacteroidia bacterium]|nr:phosphonate ABC transporter ATP-binding protein [Bacteroidia bacterium]